MTFQKSFLYGAITAFFGFLLLSELILRITVPDGFWYRHYDFSGEMTSLPELRDRLRYDPNALPGRSVYLMGDSVLGPSALMEQRIPHAREDPFQSIQDEFRSKDVSAISLGSDGMLMPDIEGFTPEFIDNPPDPSSFY